MKDDDEKLRDKALELSDEEDRLTYERRATVLETRSRALYLLMLALFPLSVAVTVFKALFAILEDLLLLVVGIFSPEAALRLLNEDAVVEPSEEGGEEGDNSE